MASPAFGTSSTVGGGFASGATNIAVPASVAADDIIVIFIHKEALAEAPTCTNFVKPSSGAAGFDEIANTTHSLYIGYKRATGADAGNYSVSVGGTNAWTEMACLRITGAITSGSPWDGTPQSATASTGTTAPSVSITTSVIDTLLFYSATHFNGGAWTPPTGMTERTDLGGALTSDTLAQAAAGSSGSLSASCATSTGRSISWLGALAPASTTPYVRPTILAPVAAVMRAGSW